MNLVDKEGTPGFVMRKFIVESTKVCLHELMQLSGKLAIECNTYIVGTSIPSDPVPCDQLVF